MVWFLRRRIPSPLSIPRSGPLLSPILSCPIWRWWRMPPPLLISWSISLFIFLMLFLLIFLMFLPSRFQPFNLLPDLFHFQRVIINSRPLLKLSLFYHNQWILHHLQESLIFSSCLSFSYTRNDFLLSRLIWGRTLKVLRCHRLTK